MNKTKIEWCDYTINPVKGLCPMACKDNQGEEYCYARRMYRRFKWNPRIRFEPELLLDLSVVPSGSRVFIGSTFELFHNSVNPEWLEKVFYFVKKTPWQTSIFLTKQPQNLIKWSPFPDNCWVGVSVTNREMALRAFNNLQSVDAKIKFLSFEPLLDNVSQMLYFPNLIKVCQWVIIGQQTPVKLATMPQVGWVEEIVNACDKANIPVFLKDNLISCVDQYDFALKDGKYRQEFPL